MPAKRVSEDSKYQLLFEGIPQARWKMERKSSREKKEDRTRRDCPSDDTLSKFLTLIPKPIDPTDLLLLTYTTL